MVEAATTRHPVIKAVTTRHLVVEADIFFEKEGNTNGRSQWPHDLRRGCAVARLLVL